MFGVDFLKAENSLIVVKAEFEVRQWNGRQPKVYKYLGGPHGAELRELQDGGWEVIAKRDVEAVVEAILPQKFGMAWTWHEFITALSFWAEGNKRGYYRGLFKREVK